MFSRLNKGIFTISIDFEFAWGYVDFTLAKSDKKRIEGEVEITKRILALFDKYNIPAAWAIVGHLLEKDCRWQNGLPHADFPRPVREEEKKDWFWAHPPQGERGVLWFDDADLIFRIKNARAGHEIASHSYAHVIYGGKGVNRAAVKKDIKSAKRVHDENGLPFYSFVFPRNCEGGLEFLKQNGIICFRSDSRKWFYCAPGALKKILHLADYFLPFAPTHLPQERLGITDIPDSMLFLSRRGLRNIIPPACIIKKAFSGLKRAADKKEIFHFWFHPSNFSFQTEKQFYVFEEILKKADALRKEGKLEILTMGEIGKSKK